MTHRPLVGKHKCNVAQMLSLISYMKESHHNVTHWLSSQTLICFSIISWLILPDLSLIFSYLNTQLTNERWKFVKTLYFWFSVQIISILGLSWPSFSKSFKQYLQVLTSWVKANLISIVKWQKWHVWKILSSNLLSINSLVDNSVCNPSLMLAR